MSPSTPLRRRLQHMGLPIALAAALSAQSALAAQPQASPVVSVVVLPPRCDDATFSTPAFLDSLRVELATSGLHCCTLAEPAAGDVRVLYVNIDEVEPCGVEPERIRIEVRQSERARTIGREISLADVAPPARARALALAVAELIRLLDEEVPEQPPKPAPSVPQRPQSKPQQVESPRAAASPYSIQVEADARIFPRQHTTLWGGRARLATHHGSFHAEVDVGGNLANVHTQLGELLVRSTSIGFGAGPRFAFHSLAFDVAPRAEIGWAWIRGTTALARVGTNADSGAVATVGFRASLEAPLNRSIVPCVALESGGVVRGFNGDVDNKTQAGISGYYVLAALGFAIPL